MTDLNHREFGTAMQQEPDSEFGWEFLREAWKSWRFVGAFAVAGLAAGGALGYVLPTSYTVKLEITAGPNEMYDQVLSQFVSPKEPNQVQSDNARPEIRIVNDAISEAVYSEQMFSTLMHKSQVAGLKTNSEFAELIKVAKMAPGRSMEKYFVPGYSVSITHRNRDEIFTIAKIYSNEIKLQINRDLKEILNEILETTSKIVNLNFDISKKKYKVDVENRIEGTKDSIDVARTGGFAKPIMPTQMPITAQIPLQDAVPRYFFGYEVLEQEKKQIENNANDETKIPGYSEFVADSNRLAALTNLLDQVTLNFVNVQIFPGFDVKNGFATKLAVAIGTTIFAITGALLIVAMRILGRKLAVSGS